MLNIASRILLSCSSCCLVVLEVLLGALFGGELLVEAAVEVGGGPLLLAGGLEPGCPQALLFDCVVGGCWPLALGLLAENGH